MDAHTSEVGSYVGAGSCVGELRPIYLCKTCVATWVFIVWVREGGTLEPPSNKFSISLVERGIEHLKASNNNCCEVQNGPVWFLYWHQSPFQSSDWLILHPNMKPKRICAARVEAPMWKCLAKALSWNRHEEVRKESKRSEWGGRAHISYANPH